MPSQVALHDGVSAEVVLSGDELAPGRVELLGGFDVDEFDFRECTGGIPLPNLRHGLPGSRVGVGRTVPEDCQEVGRLYVVRQDRPLISDEGVRRIVLVLDRKELMVWVRKASHSSRSHH